MAGSRAKKKTSACIWKFQGQPGEWKWTYENKLKEKSKRMAWACPRQHVLRLAIAYWLATGKRWMQKKKKSRRWEWIMKNTFRTTRSRAKSNWNKKIVWRNGEERRKNSNFGKLLSEGGGQEKEGRRRGDVIACTNWVEWIGTNRNVKIWWNSWGK